MDIWRVTSCLLTYLLILAWDDWSQYFACKHKLAGKSIYLYFIIFGIFGLSREIDEPKLSLQVNLVFSESPVTDRAFIHHLLTTIFPGSYVCMQPCCY